MSPAPRREVHRIDVGRVVVRGAPAGLTEPELRVRIGRAIARELAEAPLATGRTAVAAVEVRDGRPAPGTPAIAGTVAAAIADAVGGPADG